MKFLERYGVHLFAVSMAVGLLLIPLGYPVFGGILASFSPVFFLFALRFDFSWPQPQVNVTINLPQDSREQPSHGSLRESEAYRLVPETFPRSVTEAEERRIELQDGSTLIARKLKIWN